MNISYRMFIIGLQSAISHNIAQNLNANKNFDMEIYLQECKELFIAVGMDEETIDKVVDDARHEGCIEYAMGVVQSHGSAQLKPKYAYEHAIQIYKQIVGGN